MHRIGVIHRINALGGGGQAEHHGDVFLGGVLLIVDSTFTFRYGASQCGSLNNIFLKAGRLFSVLVYIRRVMTTRRDCTKSTNHLPNTITMVVEPLAPPAAWI